MSSTTPFARIVACDELGPCTVQQPGDQALARPRSRWQARGCVPRWNQATGAGVRFRASNDKHYDSLIRGL